MMTILALQFDDSWGIDCDFCSDDDVIAECVTSVGGKFAAIPGLMHGFLPLKWPKTSLWGCGRLCMWSDLLTHEE